MAHPVEQFLKRRRREQRDNREQLAVGGKASRLRGDKKSRAADMLPRPTMGTKPVENLNEHKLGNYSKGSTLGWPIGG